MHVPFTRGHECVSRLPATLADDACAARL